MANAKGISDPRGCAKSAALEPDQMPVLPAEAVAIADLTGIGVQDAAIAELAWPRLIAAA